MRLRRRSREAESERGECLPAQAVELAIIDAAFETCLPPAGAGD
jgi:hypothetical protein